mmetsp:Transcript_19371/g.36194  ORF Transcript_19371/g.36194 Transcript_19371/m.36194 type:complete len:122 (+) Transcript_19371:526-891(+)
MTNHGYLFVQMAEPENASSNGPRQGTRADKIEIGRNVKIGQKGRDYSRLLFSIFREIGIQEVRISPCFASVLLSFALAVADEYDVLRHYFFWDNSLRRARLESRNNGQATTSGIKLVWLWW